MLRLQHQTHPSWAALGKLPSHHQITITMSSLFIHPSIHNTGSACLYIQTALHLFICSSISIEHQSHHVSHPCIYLSISRSIHSQPYTRHHMTFHKSIHPVIFLHLHTSAEVDAGVESCLYHKLILHTKPIQSHALKLIFVSFSISSSVLLCVLQKKKTLLQCLSLFCFSLILH